MGLHGRGYAGVYRVSSMVQIPLEGCIEYRDYTGAYGDFLKLGDTYHLGIHIIRTTQIGFYIGVPV